MSEENEIKQLRLALNEEKEVVSVIAGYSDFCLWEYDISKDLYTQNKSVLGKSHSENNVIEHFSESVLNIGSVFSEDLPDFADFCADMKRGKKEVSCKLRVVGSDSDIFRLKFEGKLICGENAAPERYIGRLTDVTLEEEIVEPHSDRLDVLTETFNAKAFRELIEERRRGVNRYKSACLLDVGIDNFRAITANSKVGYPDYLQKTVAKILCGISACEHDCFVTRVRDGEFVMFLMFDKPSLPDVLARRIVTSVKNYIFDGNTCTVSVGISHFKSRPLDTVYAEALAALIEARRSGGRCYMCYSPTMSPKSNNNVFVSAADSDFSYMLSGPAKVYALVLQALCTNDAKNRTLLINEAFKTAGELLGASNIYTYSYDDGKFVKTLVYNATGKPLDACPCLEITCSDDEIKSLLLNKGGMRIHTGSEKIGGLDLINGAICAECRAIRYENDICKFFTIIFNSSFELNSQDIRIIDALENSLAKMNADSKQSARELATKRLRSTIINDHRIEGFTMIPGKYAVDLVQDAAADHYGLKTGDICYEKIYGRDAPCTDCPAKKLEKGMMFASTAHYIEKDRRWLDISASVDTNNDGEPRYYLSSTDITDCLGKINMTDQLTGLMTYNVFSAEALRITNEEKGVHRFTAVMNIADFRRMNEEKGYEVSDTILIAAAEALAENVGEGELLCRSDGSRFIMLLKCDSTEMFTKRMNHMMSNIQKQVLRKLRISIFLLTGAYDTFSDSIGIIGGVDRAIRAQNTIRNRAYYHENLIVFFDEALREKIQERRYIEANMIPALENNEFRVFYQPKISIETGKIVGAEALARWIRQDGEVILPGKFVPIFEENGFITDMDFAIYRRSIADIRRWLRMGLDVPLVSLNVSRHHLASDDFCEKLNALVDNIGVPHKYVELEITESLLTDHIEKLIETATWFKGKGYRISVDDFGSGYSSLNLIAMLPFDTLKIDGGFFLKNDLTEKNRKVITSVVSLAKSLNLETVSEGVETQTQVDFLRELGCDMVQGYYYFKPMPCEKFEELLVKQSNVSEDA